MTGVRASCEAMWDGMSRSFCVIVKLELFRRLAPGVSQTGGPRVGRGVRTVGDGALYATATLQLPVAPFTSTQYSNATTSLDEINSGKSIR